MSLPASRRVRAAAASLCAGALLALVASAGTSFAATSGPGTTPSANAPASPSYTAILMGTSQHCSADPGTVGCTSVWTTDDDLRAEYNRYATNARVQPALRSIQWSPSDSVLAGWERDGFKYYWTAASSDFTTGSVDGVKRAVYEPEDAGEEMLLNRQNSLGLYLHELVTVNALRNGWDWKKATADVDWARIDDWVTTARLAGKKIVWSEASRAWPAVLNSATARYYLERWKGTLVPMWGTNFKYEIADYAQPGATDLAARFGMPLGVSLQSWYFRDPGNGETPRVPNAAETTTLGKLAQGVGATYFQVEGTGADLQFPTMATPPPFVAGLRTFVAQDLQNAPSPLAASGARRVPLYQYWSAALSDHFYSRSAVTPEGYVAQGIAAYIFDRKAPGSVPLWRMYSAVNGDHYYTASDCGTAAPASPPQAYDPNVCPARSAYESYLKYRWAIDSGRPLGGGFTWKTDRIDANDIVGWVLPNVYEDTTPLWELWAPTIGDHFYTTSQSTINATQANAATAYKDPQYWVTSVFNDDGSTVKPPAMPAMPTGLTAVYDPATKVTAVSWDEVSDAGSYQYRYQPEAGTWTDWATTSYAGFDTPAPVLGLRVNVETRAVTDSGVFGPSAWQTLTVVSNPGADCATLRDVGAYSSACLDATASGNASGTDEEEAEVEFDVDATAKAASDSSPAPGAYRVWVRNPQTQQRLPADGKYWTTLRNDAGAWVIGQVPNGNKFRSVLKKDGRPWLGGEALGVAAGPVLSSGLSGCGWIGRANISSKDESTLTACTGSVLRGIDIRAFSSATNCLPNRLSGSDGCTKGSRTYLKRASIICANIGLNTNTGNSGGCHAGLSNDLGALPKGACFEWRYITKDGGWRDLQWVMGKIRSRWGPTGSWVFIRRSALDPKTSNLPRLGKRVNGKAYDQSCP